MLAIPQGACCARKRPAKDGPGENRFTTWSFKPLRTIHRSTAVRAGVNRKQHRDWVRMRPEYFDEMQMHEDISVMAAL